MDGLYLTTNMDRDTKTRIQKFMKDYRATYNKEPDMVELPRTMYSRLSLKRLKKQVLPSRLPLKIKIASLKDIDTVTGKLLYYTENGEALKPVPDSGYQRRQVSLLRYNR